MKKQLFLFSMLLYSVIGWAQQTVLTGKVISAKDKQPLVGVTVVQTGTTNGTITDENGKFSIKVNEGSTLTVMYLGYLTKVVSAQGKSNLQIAIEEDVKTLDEVVVTALGIKRSEKALGYSVQKVSGASLQKVSGTDVATSLTGKVSGLLVKNPSDFSAAPVLELRGEKPLLVIDGVPYANKTLSDMASEDIESMSVLKGATASALYGFRGANGAILITTKNGSKGDAGITVDFTTNTMFTAGFVAIPKRQGVYGRGDNGNYDINSVSSWGPVMDGTIRSQWDPYAMQYKDSPYLSKGVNNFRNYLEQGYVTNNNINVGYKGKIGSLRSSINWTENKGQYPNEKLDKFTYSFGGDINLKKFKLSSNLSYTKSKSPNVGANTYVSYGPMYSLLIWSPSDFDIRDYKNNYWKEVGLTQNYTYQSGSNNPYFDAYQKTKQINRDLFNADVTASYDITPWLKASLRSGLDFYVETGQIRLSKGSFVYTGNMSVPGNTNTWNGYMTGAYNVGQDQGFSMNNDFLLTGNRTFGKFNVDYLAGGTIYYDMKNNLQARTNGGLSSPEFFSLAASVEPAGVLRSTKGQQVNSIYGRASLSWNKMAYLEVTGRNDWSSTLPNKSYFYPSVAGSFVVSELMPNTKNWLDLLKVRGSWTVSKTPPDIYAINSYYTVNTAIWGTMNGASAPSSLYSSNILPQSASTYEVGLQGIFLKNRLGADLSYYNKNMYDILKKADISAATGYTSKYVNTQEQTARRGVEITLNGSPIRTKDVEWDMTLNWSKSGSYYTKLDPVYSGDHPWIKVGERTDAYISGKDYMLDPKGNMIYANGRIKFDPYQRKFGNTDPDWNWGIGTSLRYKNFTMSLSFDGVVGGMMNTFTETYMWQSGIHPNSVTDARAKDVANPGSNNYIGQGVKIVSGTATYDQYGNITKDTRVFAPNDVATTYEQYIKDLHNTSAWSWNGEGTRADVYSKTFFKLREMSFTYNIPSKFLSSTFIKSSSVSFVGQNVLLWSKDFKYSDPDGGHEDLSAPSVRYLGCNIKVSF